MGVTTRLYRDASNGTWPTVSIIVPVHNEEATLHKTIASLCNQIYAGDKPEIIVALNGCRDKSRDVAKQFPLKILEDEQCGMSYGKNLGASVASGDIFVFVDADTTLEPSALQQIIEAMQPYKKAVATVPGKPEEGGPVVRLCFKIANWYARRKKLQSIGPVFAVHAEVFEEIHGLNEHIKQGTSSDFIMRAIQAGAEFVFVDTICATTSIRRFKKYGIIRQLLSWRNNHRQLADGEHDALSKKNYETVR